MGNINSRFAVAVHILTLLALSEGKPMTSEFMAGSINTNAVVVRRILCALRKAGLVEAQPGVGGGVFLMSPARNVSLLDVYEAVEVGRLFSTHNQTPNPKCPVGANICRVLDRVFSGADRAMKKSLGDFTVDDIVRKVMSPAARR